MFESAVSVAAKFTQPVITSVRKYDGSVSGGLAAFVVLNPDGWFITAGHVLTALFARQQHAIEIAQFEAALQVSKTQEKAKRLEPDKEWLTNVSYWWAGDGVTATNISVNPEIDLAVGQLSPFDGTFVQTYPTFKTPPSDVPQGKSICKLGYPFHEIKPAFDKSSNQFSLPPGTLPVPRFPIEGILTRRVTLGRTQDGKYPIEFLESSTPGLRGQSGGPWFDTDATVWGIQSKTASLPLGFNAKVITGRKTVEEQQVLNVGLAVHPQTIFTFLKDLGISFAAS